MSSKKKKGTGMGNKNKNEPVMSGNRSEASSPSSVGSGSKIMKPVSNGHIGNSMLSIQSGSSRGSGNDVPGRKTRPEVEVMFQEPLQKEHECPVCAQYLRYPVQFQECGHRCCSACLPELVRVAPRCPIDNIKVDRDKVYVDKAFQKEIEMLKVKCTYFKKGCDWLGNLRELFPHLETCTHVPTLCPQGCGAEFEKRFLMKHIEEDCPKRGINCEYCDEKIAVEMKEDHLKTCPKVSVDCPNGCKKSGAILREELQNHLDKECLKQAINCPFEEAGCTFKGERKEIKKHVKEQVEGHLNYLNQALLTYQSTLELQGSTLKSQEEKLTNIEGRVEALEKLYGAQIVWKIDGYYEALEEAKTGRKKSIESKPFLTSRHGYKIKLQVALNGDGKARGKYMSVFIVICKGEYDTLLSWPFGHRVTLTLLDQCADPAARRNISQTLKPNKVKENLPFLSRPIIKEENPPFGSSKFCELDTIKTCDYIRNDTIFIKVNVDSEEMVMV